MTRTNRTPTRTSDVKCQRCDRQAFYVDVRPYIISFRGEPLTVHILCHRCGQDDPENGYWFEIKRWFDGPPHWDHPERPHTIRDHIIDTKRGGVDAIHLIDDAIEAQTSTLPQDRRRPNSVEKLSQRFPRDVRCQHWFEERPHPNSTPDEEQCRESATHVRWDAEGIDGMPLCAKHAGAKVASKPKRSISKRKRYEILLRDGFRCNSCGRTAADDQVTLHVDHQQPVSKGGSNDDENLWTLCSDCNNGKSDRL